MTAEVRILDDTETSLLESLLRAEVGALVTRTLSVRPSYIEVRDVAIRRADGRYVIIASDWSDTSQEYLDYHHIEVTVGDSPMGVPVSVSDNGVQCLGDPCSMIHIDPSERLASISVYDRREAHGDESVHYDTGLVFELADGRKFLLATPDSILGGLEFSSEPGPITEFESKYAPRTVLGGFEASSARTAG